MKPLILALIASVAISATEIPKGSHVLLRMMNSIDTRTATEGMQVYLQTASPISDGSQIVVPVGSYVQGVVTHAQRSGKVSGRAELAIRIETLTLPSGKQLKLSPHLDSVDNAGTDQKRAVDENTIKQGPDTGRDAARIAIWAGSGAAIGGLADHSWTGAGIGAAAGSAVGIATTLLTRGREVQLRQGSTLDVVFDRALTMD